jgi:hypothetical protein
MLGIEFEGPDEHALTYDQYSVLITKQVGFIQEIFVNRLMIFISRLMLMLKNF